MTFPMRSFNKERNTRREVPGYFGAIFLAFFAVAGTGGW